MPTTLTGQIERITYENEQTSFRVVRLGSLEGEHASLGVVTVIGVFQAVGPGTRVRVTGEIVNDPRHGEQLRAQSLVALEPSTLAGLEKYLGSGLIPGIGPGFAKRIVAKFGLDTLKILDVEPARLREVSGLGRRRAEEIGAAWTSQRAVSNVMVLLQTHGASPALAARIFKHYGDRAAQIVQGAPYRLALDVAGIGFRTADRIAQSIGIAGDHPERAQAGTLHELGLAAEQGHLFAPRAELVERAGVMLAIDGGHVEAALDALRASERIVAEDEAIYLSRLHAAECQTASELARLVAGECRRVDDIEHCLQAFEREQGISLAPDQRRAIVAAARHKLVVITGGPGVGKTTIVRAIVNAFDLARLDVRLAAPTGRAARRLGEATSFEASTIHRLLEFEPRTGTFQRNARNRLELDVLIVDEASMVDVPLAAALLAALPSHARLVIVGDTDQLPSVGPGAFLRDLLETDHVPRVRLTEVFRQAAESGIVRNAYRILSGVQPESASADDPDADFYVIERSDPDRAAELVQTLVVSRIPRRFGLDPRRDIQVLTPMHKGSAGTHALNTELQKALNGSGPALEVRGQSLRVGDKVMQTKNDYDRDVFNGDIGSIVSLDIEGRTLEATFDDRTVAYDDTAMDALQLAYATSIHKSQGSEYKAVVIPLLTSHFVMLSRHLVYTAVTRAKRLCVLVADPRALRLALAEARREQRLTRLTQRLDEALRS